MARRALVTPRMLISQVKDLVRTHYVFPDVASDIADVLDRLAVESTDEPAFAEAATAALRSVNGDRHLRVRHYPDGVPPEKDDEEVRAWFASLAREDGPSISEVRRLDGNVGLLTVGPLVLPPEYVGPAASAAFTLLQGVRRLVIDLRGCAGGVPESVALLVSHLLGDEPVHLLDLIHRDGSVVRSSTPGWPG